MAFGAQFFGYECNRAVPAGMKSLPGKKSLGVTTLCARFPLHYLGRVLRDSETVHFHPLFHREYEPRTSSLRAPGEGPRLVTADHLIRRRLALRCTNGTHGAQEPTQGARPDRLVRTWVRLGTPAPKKQKGSPITSQSCSSSFRRKETTTLKHWLLGSRLESLCDCV